MTRLKKVIIPVGNQFITGTLFYPDNPKPKNPAVLFIHGWTSDETGYAPRAEALTSLGYICLTISLRGHGESEGKLDEFSRQDHMQDVIAAYDFLAKKKEIDVSHINVVGASYGGYLGAILAGKRKIKNLAMRAPALFLNAYFDAKTIDVIQDREEDFFQDIKPDANNFALTGIKSVNQILLIESEHDQIIPHKIFELYMQSVDKASLTHTIIKDANHQLSKLKWKQEFIDILVEWFNYKKRKEAIPIP